MRRVGRGWELCCEWALSSYSYGYLFVTWALLVLDNIVCVLAGSWFGWAWLGAWTFIGVVAFIAGAGFGSLLSPDAAGSALGDFLNWAADDYYRSNKHSKRKDCIFSLPPPPCYN